MTGRQPFGEGIDMLDRENAYLAGFQVRLLWLHCLGQACLDRENAYLAGFQGAAALWRGFGGAPQLLPLPLPPQAAQKLAHWIN